jgi:hypothetical protein
MNLNRLILIISLLLVATFIYASGAKLWTFWQSKTGFDFFPFVKDYHKIAFWGLMIVQLLIASLLTFRRTRLEGLYGSFFLLAFLSTYLYIMLHYTDHIPCNCTGIIPSLSWEGHMWSTIAMTILAGTGIGLLSNKKIHARG